MLTFVRESGRKWYLSTCESRRRAVFLCSYCGGEAELDYINASRGGQKSCGCLRRKNDYNSANGKKGGGVLKYPNARIEGQVFGKLTAGKLSECGKMSTVFCDCGRVDVIKNYELISGRRKSCGCRRWGKNDKT